MRLVGSILFVLLTAASPLIARSAHRTDDGVPLRNWEVPAVAQRDHVRAAAGDRLQAEATALPSPQSNFVAVVPCRIVDTRGAVDPFGGPQLAASTPRTFEIPSGPCAGIPANAAAYSLNFTVVNPEAWGWLTSWPAGAPEPVVSTLNYLAGQTVANAAIVPAGDSGAITVSSVAATHLIVDINGYFPVEAKPQFTGHWAGARGSVMKRENLATVDIDTPPLVCISDAVTPTVSARSRVDVSVSASSTSGAFGFGMIPVFRINGGDWLTAWDAQQVGASTPAAFAWTQASIMDLVDLNAGQTVQYAIRLSRADGTADPTDLRCKIIAQLLP